MTRPRRDAAPDGMRRLTDERDPRARGARGARGARDVHDVHDVHLSLDDDLVRLAGGAATAALPAHDPTAVALYDWLAREARLARTPAEQRRDARRAVRFAAEMVARCGLARAEARGRVREPAPPAERAVAPLSLVDAVARSAAERSAPLLDLRVAAGDGRLLWEQACDRWVELPAGVAPGRHVALGVAGDSMRPLLEAGDTILVRLDAEPAPGALVVARTAEDGYVVKQVGRLTARSVELRSLNPAYRPRRVRRGPGVVLGVVVAWWGVRGRSAR